jgi:hypothetical protein
MAGETTGAVRLILGVEGLCVFFAALRAYFSWSSSSFSFSTGPLFFGVHRVLSVIFFTPHFRHRLSFTVAKLPLQP